MADISINAIFRWEFMSTDRDIGYGWYYKGSGERDVELVSATYLITAIETVEDLGTIIIVNAT